MILWKNGYIHTLKFKDEVHYQMATHQGLIVGFDDEINDLSFDKEIDLKNNHLYPGFVDSHLHIVGYGQKLSVIDISLYHEQEKLLNFLREQTLLGHTFFEGYHNIGITKHMLNSILNDRPLILRHRDYHSVTVNDVVLNETNLKSQTGYLTEDDAKLVLAKYQTYQHQDIVSMIDKSITKLYTYGITGGHSDDLFYFNGYQDTLKAF
ncbi:MAG: amidohydrolase family protein, partial [Acholeplasmataceae bacterium]